MTPANHKKEDATLHPGACKHSLQYYMRPGGRLIERIGMWNVGSLSGKGREVMKNEDD